MPILKRTPWQTADSPLGRASLAMQGGWLQDEAPSLEGAGTRALEAWFLGPKG